MKPLIIISLLLASLMLLTSCEGTKIVNGNPYGFCPIPVHPTQAAKDWMNQQKMPPDMVKYLYQIGTQQQDIEKYCK